MMPWLRLWNEMPTDPKWRAIGLKSKQPVSAIIAVFIMMLTNASANSKNRGSLDNWSDEDAAAALELDEEAVKEIHVAMKGKVLDGDRLTGWEKRQVLREDDSTPRVRRHRAQKGNALQRCVTHSNAPDTDADSETDAESENESASKEEFIVAGDWKVPPIEELPAHVRERAWQWPHGQYDREAVTFAVGQQAARKTEEQWCEDWNDHIVTRHRRVMKAASATGRPATGENPPWQQRVDERN
jgi:hypothetical protein